MTYLSTLRGHLGTLVTGAVDLLLPHVCNACRREDVAADGLCLACNRKLLDLAAKDYCPRCGSTLQQEPRPGQVDCPLCPQPLPRFARVVRIGPYVHPLRSIVHGMKYRREEALRRRLGRLLAAGVQAGDVGNMDLVLSVPMHWRRRLSRGYDHAASLALVVAMELHLPMGRDLVRVRPTPPQVNLPRTGRLANVRNAFAVPHPKYIAGARILLVDDVTTTGATANEAARELLKFGASSVVLAVIAKADPPRAYAEPIEA